MLEICEIGKQGWPSGHRCVSPASIYGECGLHAVSDGFTRGTSACNETQPANRALDKASVTGGGRGRHCPWRNE